MHAQSGDICKIAGRIALFFFSSYTMDIFNILDKVWKDNFLICPLFQAYWNKHNVDYTKFEKFWFYHKERIILVALWLKLSQRSIWPYVETWGKCTKTTISNDPCEFIYRFRHTLDTLLSTHGPSIQNNVVYVIKLLFQIRRKRPETIIFNVWRDFGRTGEIHLARIYCIIYLHPYSNPVIIVAPQIAVLPVILFPSLGTTRSAWQSPTLTTASQS